MRRWRTDNGEPYFFISFADVITSELTSDMTKEFSREHEWRADSVDDPLDLI